MNTSINSGGVRVNIGFLSILTLIFITLKLTDNIDWSWLWVLSPLWLPVAVVFAFVGMVLVIGGIVAVVTAIVTR